MNKGLVSVVIPVYNVEKFLPDCFDSLIKQTYKNLEIIFVNDGSTDNSKHLLEVFCSIHPNAKLINQDNKGVSVARTIGLSSATGEFLYWLDPDDMIHPRLIEIFVDLINKENADFVCGWGKKCPEITNYGDVIWKEINEVKFDIIDKNNIIKFISGKNIGSNWSLQVKLYRMSTLQKVIGFPNIIPENFSRGEDLRFNSTVISYCNTAILANHVFHMWRQRHTSLTHVKKFNTNDLKVLEALDPYLNCTECNEVQKRALLGNKAYQASLLLCTMKSCKHYILDDVEKAYKVFKENKKYCNGLKFHRPVVISTPLHILYWIGFVLKTRRLNKKK